MSGWAGKIASLKGPISKDAALLTPHGVAIVEGLLRGLTSRTPAVWALASQIGKQLIMALGRGIDDGGTTAEDAAKRAQDRTMVALQASQILGSIQAAGKTIGLAHATAIAQGVLAGSPGVVGQVRQALAEGIKAARQAVVDARGSFKDAFSSLAQQALDAFDQKWSGWTPPAQKLLDKMQLQDQVNQAKQAITDAQTQLADAQTQLAGAQTPEEQAAAQAAVVTATKSLGDAQRAQVELNLQLEADAQQKAHDNQGTKQRESLAKQLTDLQTALAKHPGEWVKLGDQVVKLLGDYGIKTIAFGKKWASNFGDGIRQGIPAAVKAARELADAVKQVQDSALKGSPKYATFYYGQEWVKQFGQGMKAAVVPSFTPAMALPGGSSVAAAGGNGLTVVVNVAGSVTSDRDLHDSIYSELQRRLGRNGRSF